MKDEESFLSASVEETMEWGRRLGEKLPRGAILAFKGELGAGKTTLIKGIVSGWLNCDSACVTSPTFIYFNMYENGDKRVVHFDLYRLEGARQFVQAGFEEYLYGRDLCCIEWSERIGSLLPRETMLIALHAFSERERLIEIKGFHAAS
jgi:tRNA threonylcarbamoyladenosine biosynthesis protein TsaE